jgi:hypothetical protein
MRPVSIDDGPLQTSGTGTKQTERAAAAPTDPAEIDTVAAGALRSVMNTWCRLSEVDRDISPVRSCALASSANGSVLAPSPSAIALSAP